MPSFRLWTIFYVFALLAAAMATFGPAGIVAAAIVVGFWGLLLYTKKPRSLVLSWLIVFCVFGVLAALLLPAISSARGAAQRSQCMNNLKQIQLAILNYEAAKRTMPPAYIADAQGRPIHSWRVLLLPFLGETALYNKYNFNEPWNGPNNSKLALQMPDAYRCPSHSHDRAVKSNETQYFAVVDPQSAWPGRNGRQIREFSDGTSWTIMVLEASGLGVNWMEPRDVSLDEAIELMTTKPRSGHSHVEDGFLTTTFYETSARNVVFVDGHVTWMEQLRDPWFAKALLTAAGGEQLSPVYEAPVQPDPRRAPVAPKTTTVIKWGVVWSLTLFVILSLLPAAWIGRRERKTSEKSIDRETIGVAANANAAT
jgi:prepilin-type processing-associated H-X9-DG protein